MYGKKTKPFVARSQLNIPRSQFKPRIHFVPIHHQYRSNSLPYTVSTCCSSTKYSSSASACSCQCSSKGSSTNESRQSRIKQMRRRQRIGYLLIFVIMIICMLVLVYIIKNTSQLEDIINYFRYAFYSPQPLINEATRKPPQSFTGKPIVWTDDLDKD